MKCHLETYRNDDLESLKEEWEKKFKDCTGNEWSDRNSFKKKSGKYYMQKLDNGKDETVNWECGSLWKRFFNSF